MMENEDYHQLRNSIETIEAHIHDVKLQLDDIGDTDSSDRVGDDARDRRRLTTATRECIDHFDRVYGEPASVEYVVEALAEQGYESSDVRDILETLRRQGAIYEPESGHVRVV